MSSDPSPGFQIDPAHTGDQPSDPLTTPLTKRWSVDLGGPVSYPVIAGGLVFATAGYSGGEGAKLFALDQGTGRSVWGPLDLGGGRWVSGLVYDAGKLFAVNEVGDLQAFDAATGSRLWITHVPHGNGTVRSAPTLRNGTIFLGSDGYTLHAYRESDGSELWQTGGTAAGWSSPAVADGSVFQAYSCQEAEAFDASTGAVKWDTPTTCTGGFATTPAVYNGRVYAREFTNGQVLGGQILDETNGAVLGQFSSEKSPAFHGTMGYFVYGNAVHAQPLGGTVDAWQFSGDGSIDTAPIIVSGTVYVGSSSGNLYALDGTTGKELWSGNVGAPVSYNDDNTTTGPKPPFEGLGAGEGVLVVPATTRLVEYSSTSGPPPPSTTPISYPSPVFPPRTPGSDAAVSLQIDPQHSGRQPNDPLAPPLHPAWSRSFGGNVSYPLIADGRVFATVANVGSGPGPPLLRTLYAMDERTGADLWGPMVLGNNTYSGVAHLAYDNGRLFALSSDGVLYAIDPATGTVIWTRTYSEPDGGTFDAAPVAINGTVFFSDQACSGSFFGIRESDGATLWQNMSHCFGVALTPSLASDGTYFAGDTCSVFDFDPNNGNTVWDKYCGGGYFGLTPIYNGRLYVRDQVAGNRSFDRETGQESTLGYSSEKSPTFDGSVGFFLTGSTLQAEDLTSNRILWSFNGDGQLITAPILVNGYVYVGSKPGNLYAVDEATGQQAWVGNAGAPMSGPPAWLSSTPDQPMVGLAAADDLLVAPASNVLTAFSPGDFIDAPNFHSATCYRQYHLTASDGQAWAPIDPFCLSVTIKPTTPATAVLGGNADLWTATAGINQDLGVAVSVNGGADQLLSWKESGGFAGTFSPNAAYVQGVFSMQAGSSYRFRLVWKANKPTGAATIYAGAGPIDGRYSPTRLTLRIDGPVIDSVADTNQYSLTGSDGNAWQALTPAFPSLVLHPTSNGVELVQANADLWTAQSGYNQDLALFATLPDGSETLVAWKESGGSAGTYSPNAAYVQGLLPVTAGQVYTLHLKWKANRKDAGTIFAGAGPIGSAYSPTRLSARMLPANPAAAMVQFRLPSSNGSDWLSLGSSSPVINASPTSDTVALIGANADLWTANAGYNQDLGIFMAVDGGTPQLIGWKESGGWAGTYSPNAAFNESAVVMKAGHTYAFSLRWKANRPAAGATIFAGAGPIDGAYSPTSLSLEAFPAS